MGSFGGASAVPLAVLGILPPIVATQISVEDWHSCALMSDHTVKCWGRGDYGQLGNGNIVNSAVPVNVIDLE